MAKIKVTRVITYDYDDYDDMDTVEVEHQECIIDTDDVLIASPSGDGTYLEFKYNQSSANITLPFEHYSAIACMGSEHLTTYTQIVGD